MRYFFGRGVKSPSDFMYDLPLLPQYEDRCCCCCFCCHGTSQGLKKAPYIPSRNLVQLPCPVWFYWCTCVVLLLSATWVSSSTCPDWWRCGGCIWPKHESSTTLIVIMEQKIDFSFLLTNNLFLLLYLPWNISIFANCWLVFMLWSFLVSGYLFTELLYLCFPGVVFVHLLIPILWYACFSQCCVGLIFFSAFSSVVNHTYSILFSPSFYKVLTQFFKCLRTQVN